MDGYEIHFDQASQAAAQLGSIIDNLQLQIKKMDEIEEGLLNDAYWYGPNKAAFSRQLQEYRTSVNNLYSNAVEHLEQLNKVLATYANAEA